MHLESAVVVPRRHAGEQSAVWNFIYTKHSYTWNVRDVQAGFTCAFRKRRKECQTRPFRRVIAVTAFNYARCLIDQSAQKEKNKRKQRRAARISAKEKN